MSIKEKLISILYCLNKNCLNNEWLDNNDLKKLKIVNFYEVNKINYTETSPITTKDGVVSSFIMREDFIKINLSTFRNKLEVIVSPTKYITNSNIDFEAVQIEKLKEVFYGS